MKKIVISQPYRGYPHRYKPAEEVIEEYLDVVDILKENDCEVVDIVYPDFREYPGVRHITLRRLAYVFDILAAHDGIYFMEGWEDDKECCVLYEACKKYHVDIITFDEDEAIVIN